MTLFDEAFEKVGELVRQFEEHEAEYLAPKYQESEVRTDFIDKFFSALGWDVHHTQQTNPREQEVKVEKNPDSNSSGRRADYAFHLKPNFRDTVFFVEAKKPSVSVGNPDSYFQIVRYGRSAKTPVGVLTDFQEFHIVDCRYEPNITKSYPSAQIKTFHYTDYLDREQFGYLYWLFSREAIEAGKLKAFALELPKQRGKGAAKLTQEEARPTDDKFLDTLEDYRLKLAKAFKKADESLDAGALTEATQKVIDRLVFIRFLEDRNIESDYIVDQIAAAANRSGAVSAPPRAVTKRGGGGETPPLQSKGSAWKSFIAWSKELDVKYNGVVFKPHEIDKPTFHAPEEKVFASICDEISHRNSKYLFSYIPVELLGSIYERFLGKIVTATAKRADIEYKPEVRKAGGVYYTPKYIVDYIVANTVGRILNGDTSARVQARASLPALPDPREAGKEALPGTQAGVGLTPKEVSKLRFADIACGSGSFLIAVYDAVLHHVESWYNTHSDEAKKAGCIQIDKGVYALSLKQKQQILLDNIYGVDIDPQAVEVAQLSLFLKFLESESGAGASQLSFERTKILPDLSKNIVCGNSLVEYDIADLFPLTEEEEKRIKPFSFQSAFKEVMSRGGFDAIVGNPPYVLLQSLDSRAVFEYLSKHFESATYKIDTYQTFIEKAIDVIRLGGYFGYITPSSYLRNVHSRMLRSKIIRTSHVRALRIFEYPVFRGASVDTCILVLQKTDAISSSAMIEIEVSSSLQSAHRFEIQQSAWSKHKEHQFGVSRTENDSILKKMISRGFPLGDIATAYFGIQTFDREKYVSEEPRSSYYKPIIDGGNVGRYTLSPAKEYVDFRPQSIKSGGKAEVYEQERIVVRQIGQVPIGTLVSGGLYALNTTYNIFPIVTNPYDLRYLLGIISSNAVGFFWRNQFFDQKKTFPKVKKESLLTIPIPLIDFALPDEKKKHDTLRSLVDQMLATKKQHIAAQRESERERLQQKCDYLDGEIDRLVYALYGLTAEEIRIVEGTDG